MSQRGGESSHDNRSRSCVYRRFQGTGCDAESGICRIRTSIFPVDMRIDNALALKDVEEILPWYSEVNPERTISIVNEMKMRVKQGETIFYDIYTDEEKAKDLAKKDTGLFFFSRKSRRKVCHNQCRRRFCLCGSHA